jgi:hypothetical protein
MAIGIEWPRAHGRGGLPGRLERFLIVDTVETT